MKKERRDKMKKVLTAFFFCLIFSVSVQAKDVLPTNKTTASEGCTLVGVEGEYITDAQNALKRINEIRYEACKEGVWKMDIYGDPTTEKLTLSDYKPIKWSSALEYIARIRAAEATVVLAHERPNDENFFTSTLKSNGQKSYSENLAWNGGKSMLSGIEQWYEEKSDWVNKTGKTTGHYTSMINPDYNYVAVATFYNPDAAYKNATSAEFSHKTGLDETMNEMAGECIQTLEVKDSYLSLKLPVNNTSIKAGENTQAQASAVITNPSAIMNGETCEASLIGDITWTSSNKQVATVDKDGKITGIDYGTATITANSGTLSQTITVNVTTHAWDTGKVTTPATYTKTGIKTYICKVCGTKKTEAIRKIPMPKVGTVYTIAGNLYRITKVGAEVSLIKTNAKAKSINIPAIIKANGITYKVTTIAAKAFKQNKKLQSVTVGANVKSISNNAFFKCPSLKTVNLKTVLLTSKTASKKAFKGANKKLVIKVPKKVKKSYKKIFKGQKVE